MSKNERPPVIVVVGHIDHGKSKLLDYIRKSNVVASEAGGITQHISAYEVKVPLSDGKGKTKEKEITFIDTPGHASFSQMRTRGCNVADVAILIVSAEEGVKAQTLEALKSIKECKIPFVVAINKIDKPEANIEKTKNSLLEHEVYLEGLGGDIPFVPISAETGKGVPELLETIALMAEIEELESDKSKLAEGYVIEANLDQKRGISASLIIKDGSLKSGMHVVAGNASAPVRIMENFLGKPTKEAGPSDPIRIIGWDNLPEVGASFQAFKNKKEAGKAIEEKPANNESNKDEDKNVIGTDENTIVIPVTLKADTQGSLEAIIGELEKIQEERVLIKIVGTGIGNITENDVKSAGGSTEPIILGFGVKEDKGVRVIADRLEVKIEIFDIIYKLTEWLEKIAKERKPKIRTEEITGKVRVLKIFSKAKDKQVIGGEVFEGSLNKGDKVRVLRRGEEIGTGHILELQVMKAPAESVKEGNQFGAKVSSSVEIAERDNFESFTIVEK